MPMNLYELQQERKSATLYDGRLNLTYRPHKLTPAKELAMLRGSDVDSDDPAVIAQAKRNIQRQLEAFAELVEAWDFLGPLVADAEGEGVDADKLPIDLQQSGKELELEAWLEEHMPGAKVVVGSGQTCPLVPDCLKLISSNFLMQIVAQLNEDMRPNVRKRGN
jgi:hypothetical protein